jgi:hypothetical protein
LEICWRGTHSRKHFQSVLVCLEAVQKVHAETVLTEFKYDDNFNFMLNLFVMLWNFFDALSAALWRNNLACLTLGNISS